MQKPEGVDEQLQAMEAKASGDGRGSCPIMIRSYVDRVDRGFVTAAWARQIRRLAPYSKMSQKHFRRECKRIEALIGRAPPLIACEPEHPEQDFGFVCGEFHGAPGQELRVLHFIYVKNVWRGLGVGTGLMLMAFSIPRESLGKVTICYTYPGRATPHIAERWGLLYEPDRTEI